ncbi:NUDIX hydrolase [Microbacterium testaceum]|uniref:NUDIX hydrolase n=1 Tax=Microbacterium testaceum TaxID=2033 RepID=UPI002AC4A890|nr:NUDIX hydrolase [Microbacterium testaceum]MDZ5143188.1 NUDIX hydrolase [Microbacterium testaceum]
MLRRARAVHDRPLAGGPRGRFRRRGPLHAAKRELLEETGVTASDWSSLGRMNALNGIADAPEYVFLARGLTMTDAAVSQREEGIDAVRWIPFAEALELVASGEVSDGETIGALALAGIRLGRFR